MFGNISKLFTSNMILIGTSKLKALISAVLLRDFHVIDTNKFVFKFISHCAHLTQADIVVFVL